MSQYNNHMMYSSLVGEDISYGVMAMTKPGKAQLKRMWEDPSFNNWHLNGWTRKDLMAVVLAVLKAKLDTSKAGKIAGYSGEDCSRMTSINFRMQRNNINLYELILDLIKFKIVEQGFFQELLSRKESAGQNTPTRVMTLVCQNICRNAIRAHAHTTTEIPTTKEQRAAACLGVHPEVLDYWLNRYDYRVHPSRPELVTN